MAVNKSLLSSAFTLLALVSNVAFSQSGLDLAEYELVFSDEFDSTHAGSTVDPEKWSTRFYWGPYVSINSEEQLYVDTLGINNNFPYSPLSIENGILTIEAIPIAADQRAPNQPNEDDAIWEMSPDLTFQQGYEPDNVNYLSGLITSNETYNATHGYFEARLKFPSGRGLWPAFWLLNTKYVENSPEIDIVEFLGHKKNTVHHTLHYLDVANGWRTISSPTFETSGPDYTADFHTYGLAWDPTKISFYVDGNVVREVSSDDFLISSQSMYLILNLAVGGNWPGSPDATTQFPAKFEIDYVRAYERKSVPVITKEILDEEYQLMFSDDFNGNSINTDLWNSAYLWGPYLQINNEEQVYIDKLGLHENHPVNPFEVSSGTLKIKAEPIASSDLPELPETADPAWNNYETYRRETTYLQNIGWTPTYSSGVLTTYDAFKFVNGYVEARIKMPVGRGLWPAFWLLNGYYVGPSPEMDIVEVRGGEPFKTHHSYHFQNSMGILQSSAEVYNLPSSGVDQFYTYGFQWDRERMVWYVDGVPVRELSGPEVSTQLSYLILNLAVGGNFVTDVDQDAVPAAMEIDWVKVWQINSTPPLMPDSSPVELPLPTVETPIVYEYYEGNWDRLPDFDSLEPKKIGLLSEISISPRDRDDYFAFRYTVNFNVTTPESYTFRVTSSDGSRLFIDGQLLINNDGQHNARSQEGSMFLTAGNHEIAVEYFEKVGEQVLSVEVGVSGEEMVALGNAPPLPDTQSPSWSEGLLTAVNISSEKAELNWPFAEDNEGIQGYVIYVNGNLIDTIADFSYTLSNLTPNTTYSVSVYALDSSNNISSQPLEVEFSTQIAQTTQSPAVYFSTSGTASIPEIDDPADDANIYMYTDSSTSSAWIAEQNSVVRSANIDALSLISDNHFYMSFTSATVLPGIGQVQDRDIVEFSNGVWSIAESGSDIGLTSSAHDIDALSIFNDEIYLSILGNTRLNGLGTVDDADILKFNGVNLELFWDASDYSIPANADVDGISVVGEDNVYLSFNSNKTVLPVLGVVNDEDIVEFREGNWSLYFDGSVAALSSNRHDIDAFSLGAVASLSSAIETTAWINPQIEISALSSNTAQLDWSGFRIGDDFQNFRVIYSNGINETEILTNSNSTQITNLTTETEYFVSVQIVETGGNVSGNGPSAGFLTPPTEPELVSSSIMFSTVGNSVLPGLDGPFDDADIYTWSNFSYSNTKDASAYGIPNNADVDGLHIIGEKNFLVSFLSSNTSIPTIGSVQDEDIIQINNGVFSVFFNATAEGLTAGGHDIDAFSYREGNIYFSISGQASITGVGVTDDADIVAWNGVSFSKLWIASDYGIPPAADMDALEVLGENHFLISFSNASLTIDGLQSVQDEDILEFNQGEWSLHFDGSANGLNTSGHDIDAFGVVLPR